MDLSIVIPAFNEQQNIAALYSRLVGVIEKTGRSYEIIYVDDGSSDGTMRELQKLYDADPHVKVVEFQRNFGKSYAYSAGFALATGDIVITMDADLQDDPEEIPLFLEKMEEGYDFVTGWKHSGKSSGTTFVLSVIFNTMISLFTRLKIHDLNCPFKAFRNHVVKKLNIYGDLHRYIPILVQKDGFSMAEIKVSNQPRLHGESKYTFKKYLVSFFDFITIFFISTYSERPLHFFGRVGLSSFVLGVLVDIYAVLWWILRKASIDDSLPTLLLGILLILIGVQFTSMGLLGEMQLRNLRESNPESKYTIKRTLTRD
ncbi:MAG: glycosyltransferase family 2 protein [Candidatus Krumholzibacteriota bacterium]|nr:glycosyltransferase family 2 protein [Candidatus Krumholzibacteriota bacterium]